MSEFKDYYKTNVVEGLKKIFKYGNVNAVPLIDKVVVNVGASKALSDPSYHEVIEGVLSRITGQKPVANKAKKSIAAFKIREGMVVGYKVTLRGLRMYDFLQKLVHVTLPRVRDFQGLNRKSFDGKGNYIIGFREYTAFPEIKSDEIEKLHGLEVCINTTAKSDEEAFELLKLMGFPFKHDEKV